MGRIAVKSDEKRMYQNITGFPNATRVEDVSCTDQ